MFGIYSHDGASYSCPPSFKGRRHYFVAGAAGGRADEADRVDLEQLCVFRARAGSVGTTDAKGCPPPGLAHT